MTKTQIAAALLLLGASLFSGEELVRNGDFKAGDAPWAELGSDEGRECKVTPEGLLLKRKAADAKVIAVQYNLKLKPQTLYRFSVTGKGDTPATITLRPQSSKDPQFEKVLKAWALYTCPLPASKEQRTESLLFDSGLKAESAYTHVTLNGKEPGSFVVSKISLQEIGPAKPDPTETVVLSIGDSITITSYLPFSQRIDALLAEKVAKEMADAKVRFINVGVDGEYSKELLETNRYEKVIKENLQKVDVAVIRYGANDQKRYDADEFKKQIRTLCDNLQRHYPGVKIVLGTGPYLHGNPDINKKYGVMWQAARDLAAERNYPLADVYKKFEADGSLKPVNGVNDMHPSAYGVQLAAEVIFEAIKPLLKPQK
ncbi:MAG TPA: SGNH/GDSL hydrolase family protein [Planctomycetota bacterium]|nr:SGNH/GDSL hydrolase family protein [Planctomycetota bacterium]